MNASLFQQINLPFNKKKTKVNKKLVIYAFFVVLATIFWFLNALSKEYTTTVTYPVDYVNFPKDKVLINELPAHLTLKVNADGFDLLRYKMSTSFLPITFNVNAFTDNRMEQGVTLKYQLPTSHIKDRISQQISSKINLLSVSPDTLVFKFSNVVHRKVAVKADLKLNFEKQFMLSGSVGVDPDSVIVSGPSIVVDTIPWVLTRNMEFSQLTRSTKRNVSLEYIKGLEFTPKRVVVHIPVEQFTESDKRVNIEIENLPDSLRMRLFPNKIKVSYLVGLNRYETITKDQFRVVVDYPSSENPQEGNLLKVRIVQYPNYLKNVRFYPPNVEYIIEKKNPFIE